MEKQRRGRATGALNGYQQQQGEEAMEDGGRQKSAKVQFPLPCPRWLPLSAAEGTEQLQEPQAFKDFLYT